MRWRRLDVPGREDSRIEQSLPAGASRASWTSRKTAFSPGYTTGSTVVLGYKLGRGGA